MQEQQALDRSCEIASIAGRLAAAASQTLPDTKKRYPPDWQV